MKKLLLTLTAMVIVEVIQAQSYTFRSDFAPYQEITDRLQEDTVLENYFEFSPNFSPIIFGKKTLGTMTAGTSSGYLVMGNNSFSYALDPLLGAIFQKISTKSRVNVTTIITSEDTQLVVQWKEMGFYGHPDNHYVNCQVRISKPTGIITYHYGKNSYVRIDNDSAFSNPANTGPEVLLVKLTTDFSNVLEFNTVAGDPEAPYFTSQFKRMIGLPLENQRFIFSPKSPISSVANAFKEKISIVVFPNPMVGKSLFIESSEKVKSIIVRNILGQPLEVRVLGLDTKNPEITFTQTGQPLWLEITLTGGETIIRKITVGN